MKGVPESDLDATVTALLNRLGLAKEDAEKLVGKYSGGMKRSLGERLGAAAL